MKTDRKIKAEKSPPKVKAVKENSRSATKLDGKRPFVAYEHIPVGIVEASLDGKYMDVNEEFCRILGYSRKELLRRGIKSCTHEEDYAIDHRLYQQLLAGKIPFYRLEKRFVRKDGNIVWVELTRSLVNDAEGKPLYTVGVVLDISDRKDVERVLRDSVERLRLATGAAQMFMWEWDFQTQSYTIADNFEKVLGFSAGLLPRNNLDTVWALSPKEDVHGIAESFVKAVENQSDLHALPCRVINPENGEIVWLEISAKIIYDSSGNPKRMFGVAQNITESKKAEAALELARKQAEQSADRTTHLQQITAALSEALTPPQVAEILTNEGARTFGAVSSSMMLLTQDGQTLEIAYSTSSEFSIRPYQRFPISLHVPAADAVRSGQPVWIESRQEYLARYPHLADQIHDWGQQAALAIPMAYEERVLGVFTLSFDRALPHTLENENYFLTLARQGAQALERARAEDALRESEERFRAMVSQTTAGIAESDLDSRLVFVNSGFCEILGYSEEELLGKTIWELTYTEDLEENKRLFKRMLEQGDSYQFEKRFIRKDGSPLWTNVSVTTIHDLTGKPKGGVGVILDIETRKQSESALAEYARQQEALYKLSDELHRTASLEDIFNAALDAILNALRCDRASILLFDAKDVMRFVAWRGLSEEYRKATDGHSPWKPDTKNPEPIPMEDVRTADLNETLRDVILGEGIGSLAFIPLVSNGKLIGKFMIYFNAPHTFNRAELDLSLTIAHQLASGVDRKRAGDALERERELLERLFETMPVMVSMIDPVSNSLRLNAEFERRIGWKSDEVTVLSLLEALYPDPDYRSQLLQRMASAAGKDEWVEVQLRTRDGRTIDSMWSNISIMEDQKLVMGIAIGIDITERKQAEKRLAMLAEISEILRNVEDTHELMYMISKAVGEHLGVKRVLFNEIDLEHDRETVHRDYHNGLESAAGVHKVSAYSSVTSKEVAAGKTVVNMDSKTDPRTSQDYERTYAQSGERSYVVVPMMRENRWVASLWVSDDTPRNWSNEEVSLLETIAERTWTVIEKLRIAEELRAKEAELEDVINQTPFMLTRCTSDLRYRFVSRAYAEMIGRTPEEIAGKPIVEIMGEEGLKTISPYIEKVLQGQYIEYENEVPFQGIGTPFLHVAYTPDWDEQGHVIGWFASIVDITERKRAEEALRRNEQMFSTLVDAAPFGVYFIDSEFRLRSINKGAEAVFSGVHPLIGRDFAEILRIVWQEPFATEVIERFRHTLRTGESFISPPIVEPRANIDEIEAYDWQIHRIALSDGTYGVVCYFYDLSEQKRMEATVRASETLYRAIARNIPGGGVYVVDKDFRYLIAEGPVTEAFGLSREMLEGRTVSEAFPGERGERMEMRLRKNFAGESVDYETTHNGRVYWTQQAPLLDSIGHAIILTLDITERKQAEEALRESEERFRAILKQATAGIVRKDADGRLVFVNEAFCNMLGYTESELLGKTVWEFMHPDDIVENQRYYDRLMREGIPFKLERRFLREDGSVIWVDASVSAIMDSAGKPQSAVAVEVDITGRKQAEEALRELNIQLEDRVLSRTAKLREVNQTLREEITERQRVEEALRQSEALARANEEKLSTLFELLPVGISFLDPEGQIIQVNPALTHILKLPKQLSGQMNQSRSYIRANGTRMPPTEFASQRALREGKTVYNLETGVILEDGEVIWTSVSAAPVNVADVGAVVVTADITESKRAERALQESRERLQILSQRLVEVQEEERRAIARELHDRVGQTLAALNINLIIISGQLGDRVDEQIRSRLGDSMKLVAETIALVRDVMSNLRPSVLDDYGLEAAIDSHLNQFTARYGIQVKFEKSTPPIPRLGSSVEMTFLRIAQEALMNIARHAEATEVNLSLSQEGDMICMTVRDNGTGIISWESANRPGSHGLTIMRERAEAVGGNLKVNSVPGKGTKVEVKVPIETNAPSRAEGGKNQ